MDVKELKSKLLVDKKNGYKGFSEAEHKAMNEYCEGSFLCTYYQCFFQFGIKAVYVPIIFAVKLQNLVRETMNLLH